MKGRGRRGAIGDTAGSGGGFRQMERTDGPGTTHICLCPGNNANSGHSNRGKSDDKDKFHFSIPQICNSDLRMICC